MNEFFITLIGGLPTLLIYIIRWSLVLTLLYSLYGVFLRGETFYRLNRTVLVGILLASMALPFCTYSSSEQRALARSLTQVEQRVENVMLIEETDSSTSVEISQKTSVSSAVWRIIIATYLVGLAIAWVQFSIALVSVLLIIARGKRREVEGRQVIISEKISSPCSFFGWILLTPRDINDDAHYIVAHEEAHVRLLHSADVLLAELTCRMLWFLPFAWMLKKDLKDVHEYQADQRVIQQEKGAKNADSIGDAYQHLLIRRATQRKTQPIVNSINQCSIKKRFIMMYKKPSSRWLTLKAVYLLPMAAIALTTFARPTLVDEIGEKLYEVKSETVDAIVSHDAQTATTEPVVKTPKISENSPMKPQETIVATTNDIIVDTVVMQTLSRRSVQELLDSTMLAVGAKKLSDGMYLGAFQPNINNDTVRVAQVRMTDNHGNQEAAIVFQQYANDPLAYEIELMQEDRKDHGQGYHIRTMRPTNRSMDSKEKYTQKKNPYLRPANILYRDNAGGNGWPKFELELMDNETYMTFSQNAVDYPDTDPICLVDDETGDRYMCRGLLGGRPQNAAQVTLVFPPLGKKVKRIRYGVIADGKLDLSEAFLVERHVRRGKIIK